MSHPNPASDPSAPLSEREQAWVRVILEKIRAIRYGTVQIKIHDAQVVLIEATEQTRFELSTKPRA